MSTQTAENDYPIMQLLANRSSSCGFKDRPVPEADLCSLFDAARWAASSYNQQPWCFLVATRGNPMEFAQLLDCLAEGHQVWGKVVPVLALSFVSWRFAGNDQVNRSAVHVLRHAALNLVAEATSRGLFVHQMNGILLDKAREVYQIPEHFEAWTALAIGYKADPENLTEIRKKHDLEPGRRKSLSEYVFAGQWGKPSRLVL